MSGDGGDDWEARRPRRRPAAPGGSRGPDRPRGQSGSRQAADGRGPGRPGSGRAAAARIGPSRGAAGQQGRSGSGRPGQASGGQASGGQASQPRSGSGRSGGPGSSRAQNARAGARQRGGAALRAPARARAILRRRNPRGRLNATLIGFAVVLSLFAGRLVQMQGLDWSRYRTLAEQQRTATFSIPTVRGSITTADGTVLAMTVQTDAITADPAEIPTTAPAGVKEITRSQVASELAGPLNMTPAAIAALLSNSRSSVYQVLKKTVSAATGSHIQSLDLPGINVLSGTAATKAGLPGYQRNYPNGALAANLVGFTDASATTGDLTGEAGLEQEYNRLLSGKDGSYQVEVGTNQLPIAGTEERVKQPRPAENLRLTIQSSIQYEAERECKLRVQETKARNCSIVVIDPQTGAILAMAQYPVFNPNKPVTNLAATRNIAVSNVFAPGSTLKPLTVAAALEKGGQTPLSTYTVPWQIKVDGFNFHDAESHPTAKYTIAGILANSLNDGMVQIVQHITPLQQYQYLRDFGLGSLTNLGLPGESAGLLAKPGSKNYWEDEPFELSFGQGIGVTAIQMASVYATIANGGVRVQPTIVAGTTSSSGKFIAAPRPPHRRVIQAKTAGQLMTMMEQVPKVDAQQGEPWGLIAGYPVASKTGTAQVPNLGGCLCQYGSSYIGIAPAQSPKLVVAVNVQDPRAQGYYGDEIAGPVFYHVMKFALATLKIPPTRAKAPYIRLMQP